MATLVWSERETGEKVRRRGGVCGLVLFPGLTVQSRCCDRGLGGTWKMLCKFVNINSATSSVSLHFSIIFCNSVILYNLKRL